MSTADECRDDAFMRLRTCGTLAIVRYRAGGDTAAVVAAMVDGGIGAVEVTTNTPGWERVLRTEIARNGDRAIVGAGTVLNEEHVLRAVDAGARFIVSPGFDRRVVDAAIRAGLEVLPGVATATEIMAAEAAGVRILKLFPAGALGLDHLRQLRGPFGESVFAATGGIAVEDVAAWHRAGADIVCLGSDLSGSAAPATEEDWRALRERVRLVARAR